MPVQPTTSFDIKAAAVQDGAMVAFFVPADVAQTLTEATVAAGVQTPEPVENCHLTLVYLGKVADHDGPQPIADALKAAVAGLAPITGVINGIGRFTHDSDGTNALYASFDSPALPRLRQRLADALDALDLNLPSEHGFIPHITLAYLPADAPTPDLRLPRVEMTFDAVTLAWGGERTEVPLTADDKPAEAAATDASPDQSQFAGYTIEDWGAPRTDAKAEPNYTARAGEVITGNLARSATGQFTSAGNASAPAPKPAAAPAPAAPAQPTPQQRAGATRRANNQRERKTNRATAFNEVAGADNGIAPDAARGLLTFADGGSITDRDANPLVRAGLVERGVNGEPRLTPQGRQVVAAMNRGDVRATLDAISRGKERVAKAKESEAAKAARAAAVAQRKAERQAERDRKAKLSAEKKAQREAERQRKAKEREVAKAARAAATAQKREERLAARANAQQARAQAQQERAAQRATQQQARAEARAKAQQARAGAAAERAKQRQFAREQTQRDRAYAKQQREQARADKANARAQALAEKKAEREAKRKAAAAALADALADPPTPTPSVSAPSSPAATPLSRLSRAERTVRADGAAPVA